MGQGDQTFSLASSVFFFTSFYVMSTVSKSVFENKEIAAKLADIHGMGSNDEQYITYQATNFSKQEILSNHK